MNRLTLILGFCFVCFIGSIAHGGPFTTAFSGRSGGAALNVADNTNVAPAVVNPAIQPKANANALTTAQALALTQNTCNALGGPGCSPNGNANNNGGMGQRQRR